MRCLVAHCDHPSSHTSNRHAVRDSERQSQRVTPHGWLQRRGAAHPEVRRARAPAGLVQGEGRGEERALRSGVALAVQNGVGEARSPAVQRPPRPPGGHAGARLGRLAACCASAALACRAPIAAASPRCWFLVLDNWACIRSMNRALQAHRTRRRSLARSSATPPFSPAGSPGAGPGRPQHLRASSSSSLRMSSSSLSGGSSGPASAYASSPAQHGRRAGQPA